MKQACSFFIAWYRLATKISVDRIYLFNNQWLAVHSYLFHLNTFVFCLQRRFVGSNRYILENNAGNFIQWITLHYAEASAVYINVRKTDVANRSEWFCTTARHIKKLFPWKHFNDGSATAANFFNGYVFINLVSIGTHF